VPIKTTGEESSVSNFEFESLGFICDLFFGAWNFPEFDYTGRFTEISQLYD
jgi:hypothetical protein